MMTIINTVCTLLLALFFGIIGVVTLTAPKPVIAIIALSLCVILLIVVIYEAVEQIKNANKPQIPTVLNGGMTNREVRLIYITEHPNRFTEDQVRNAHLQLDEMYYNRCNNKD